MSTTKLKGEEIIDKVQKISDLGQMRQRTRNTAQDGISKIVAIAEEISDTERVIIDKKCKQIEEECEKKSLRISFYEKLLLEKDIKDLIFS